MRALTIIRVFLSTLIFAGMVWAGDPPKTSGAPAADLQLSPDTHFEYDALLKNGFTIRFCDREVRADTIRLYVSCSSRNAFVDVASDQIASIDPVLVQSTPPATPAARSLPQLVDSASDKHQIDADLISSVIRAESDFNPRAVSPKGAQGLMQLMPDTASKLGVKNAFDPQANIDGGTRYLRELLLFYNGDIIKALAAYNAGPERVEQYHGVPPYRETRAYVARVVHDFNKKKVAQARAQQKSAAAKSSRTGRKPPSSDERQHANGVAH